MPSELSVGGQRANVVLRFLVLAGVLMLWFVRFEPSIADMLFAAAIVVWATQWIQGRATLRLDLADYFLLAFVLINVMGVLWTPNRSSTLKFSFITIYLAVFFVVSRQLLRDEGLRAGVIKAYLVASAISASLMWVGWLSVRILGLHSFMSFLLNLGRPAALFKDANVAGLFLVPAAMYVSEKVTESKLDWRNALSFFFVVGALIYSASRTAVLSFLFGAALMFLLTRARWHGRIRLATVTAATLLVLSFLTLGSVPLMAQSSRVMPHQRAVAQVASDIRTVLERLTSRASGAAVQDSDQVSVPAFRPVYHYDTGGRLYAWRAGLVMFRQRPLFGFGAGTFESLSPGIETKLGASVITLSAHSTPIRVLAENGLLGFLLYAGFTVVILVLAWRQRRREGSGKLWILLSALTLLLVSQFFIDTLHHRHIWLFLALL